MLTQEQKQALVKSLVEIAVNEKKLEDLIDLSPESLEFLKSDEGYAAVKKELTTVKSFSEKDADAAVYNLKVLAAKSLKEEQKGVEGKFVDLVAGQGKGPESTKPAAVAEQKTASTCSLQ